MPLFVSNCILLPTDAQKEAVKKSDFLAGSFSFLLVMPQKTADNSMYVWTDCPMPKATVATAGVTLVRMAAKPWQGDTGN